MLRSVCESRKSTRVFSEESICISLIDKVIAIAYTSPYASGRKNWEITAVTDRAMINDMAHVVDKKIKDIAATLRPDMQADFTAYAASFSAFRSAPAIFALSFRVTQSLSLMMSDPNPDVIHWERDNCVKSISCVAMLVLLAAESLGLGSCYMTGPLIADKELAELIRIKKGRSLGALIPVGYIPGGTS